MTYWQSLQNLVDTHSVKIDRPKNSTHPKYPEYIYPFDYGYFEQTQSADGGGIDVWVGSLGMSEVSGIVVVLDPVKGDSEIKIVIGATPADMNTILAWHHRGNMTGILILKP
jgi:inorganic pyrophosphatase